MVADHLSQLPIGQKDDGKCSLPIDDPFPNKHFFALDTSNAPWFTDVVNYLVCGILPPDRNSNQKKKFFS